MGAKRDAKRGKMTKDRRNEPGYNADREMHRSRARHIPYYALGMYVSWAEPPDPDMYATRYVAQRITRSDTGPSYDRFGWSSFNTDSLEEAFAWAKLAPYWYVSNLDTDEVIREDQPEWISHNADDRHRPRSEPVSSWLDESLVPRFYPGEDVIMYRKEDSPIIKEATGEIAPQYAYLRAGGRPFKIVDKAMDAENGFNAAWSCIDSFKQYACIDENNLFRPWEWENFKRSMKQERKKKKDA